MKYELDRSFVTEVAPDLVYEYLRDISSSRDWTDAKCIELVGDGPMQVGSRWRSIGSVLFGGERCEEYEAVEMVPGRLIRLRTSSTARSVDAILNTTFALSSAGQGTQVTYREAAVVVKELPRPAKASFLPKFDGPGAWAGERAVLVRHRVKLLREELQARVETGSVVYRTSPRGWLLAGGLFMLAFGTIPLGVCPTIFEERRHQSQASLVGTQWMHFGLGAPVGSAVWVKNRLRSPVLGACLAYPAVARLVRHSFRIL